MKKPPSPFMHDIEIMIMILICNDYKLKDIAKALAVPHSLIIKYRNSLSRKIGATKKAGIVVYATQHGICKL